MQVDRQRERRTKGRPRSGVKIKEGKDQEGEGSKGKHKIGMVLVVPLMDVEAMGLDGLYFVIKI